MVVFLAGDEAGRLRDFELVLEVVVQQERMACCVAVKGCINVQLRKRILKACFGSSIVSHARSLVSVGSNLDDSLRRLLLLSVGAVSEFLALGFEGVVLAVSPLACLVQVQQVRVRFNYNFLGFLLECLG